MSATDLAAQATAAGTSALFVSMIGVEPQTLVWSVVGSVIGVALAKPAGRAYAVALFLAATLTCGLLATIASAQWFDNSAMARNGLAVLLGAAFHPGLQAFFASIPAVVEACKRFVVRRIGGGS